MCTSPEETHQKYKEKKQQKKTEEFRKHSRVSFFFYLVINHLIFIQWNTFCRYL